MVNDGEHNQGVRVGSSIPHYDVVSDWWEPIVVVVGSTIR